MVVLNVRCISQSISDSVVSWLFFHTYLIKLEWNNNNDDDDNDNALTPASS